MPSLRELQIAFYDAIRSEAAGSAADWVIEGTIPAQQRIQIYRNNYVLGALSAMQATYPVIERLAGPEWFSQSVAAFQREHPASLGDLQDLGASYPEFLRRELVDTDFAYFADVAELEWAYQLVTTAPEQGPVDLARLNGVTPGDYADLRFVPRSALRLLQSAFPILAIWRANQPTSLTNAALRLDAGSSRVLLIRRPDHVELRELAQGSFELLRQFQFGAPLGEAAATVEAAAASRDMKFDLAYCLQELLGLDTIADILPPPRTHYKTGRTVDG